MALSKYLEAIDIARVDYPRPSAVVLPTLPDVGTIDAVEICVRNIALVASPKTSQERLVPGPVADSVAIPDPFPV